MKDNTFWHDVEANVQESRDPDLVTVYIRQQGTLVSGHMIKRGFKIEFTEEAWKSQMQLIPEHGHYPSMMPKTWS